MPWATRSSRQQPPPPAGERNAELDMSACGFAAHSSVLRSLRVVLADLIACKYLICTNTPIYCIALHHSRQQPNEGSLVPRFRPQER
jgi:hypothetical protein